MKHYAAAIAASLALVACGGGGGDREYDDPADLASALGCSDVDAEDGAAAPADVATCRFEGETVTLVVGSDDDIKATTEVAKGFGSDFTEVKGGNWAVLAEDRDTAEKVAEKIGGDLE